MTHTPTSPHPTSPYPQDKKRPAFISTLMSCGGGKGGRAAAEMDTGLKPTDRPESVHGAEIVENQDNEVIIYSPHPHPHPTPLLMTVDPMMFYSLQ